jgi:UDP-N-acetylmuramoylalanine--D-glutamate ligase
MTKYIGVAGTVGKSTTVKIISLLLRNSRYTVHEVQSDNFDNVAEFKEELAKTNVDFVVAKIPVDFLKEVKTFNLDISVLLNISETQDLLRMSQDDYIKTISKVYEGTKEFCIFNATDRIVDRLVQEAEVEEGVRAIGFSHRTPSRGQVGVVEGIIVDRANYDDNTDPLRFLNATDILDLRDYSNLNSPINTFCPWLVDDVCAAVAVVRALNIDVDTIARALHQFRTENGQNQLIYKRELKDEPGYYFGNVHYINDTKSQDIASTSGVFVGYNEGSVIWIGGGDTKSLDYSRLINEVKRYLSSVIVIGTTNSPIYQKLREICPRTPIYLIQPTEGLSWVQDAVNAAEKMVFENKIVLFSPAADLSVLGEPNEINNEFNKCILDLKKKYDELAKVHEFDRN